MTSPSSWTWKSKRFSKVERDEASLPTSPLCSPSSPLLFAVHLTIHSCKALPFLATADPISSTRGGPKRSSAVREGKELGQNGELERDREQRRRESSTHNEMIDQSDANCFFETGRHASDGPSLYQRALINFLIPSMTWCKEKKWLSFSPVIDSFLCWLTPI